MRLNASVVVSLMLFGSIYGSKAFGQGSQSYAQEIAKLHQEIDSLKHNVDSIVLQQRLNRLEERITEIQKDMASPDKLKENLRQALIVEIALYYSAFSVPFAIIIGLLGYASLEAMFFRYLRRGKYVEKLFKGQDFLDRLEKTVLPNIEGKALPIVEEKAYLKIVDEYQKKWDNYWPQFIGSQVKDTLAERPRKLPAQALQYPVTNKASVSIEFGDITNLVSYDIIVSSDDTLLRMAGGVAKKIRDAGGDEIFEQAKGIAPIKLEDVAVTKAGKLKARYVFHPAVIDINAGKYPDERIIRSAVRNCFLKVDEQKESLQSIAFPILGAGTGGLSLDHAAQSIARQVLECLQSYDKIQKVAIVIFNPNELKQNAQELFGNIFGASKSKSNLPKA
jgi:O-acetyl-ADP-ribose deacetylase (regulator of RNase III)